MATISEAIQIGLAHQQAGRFEQAEQIYRQILKSNPRHPGALHLLGLIASVAGKYELAVQLISQAIRHDGAQAVFHASLAEAYRGLGRLDEAKTCYQQALRIKPDLAEASNNLGTILQAQGQLAAAMACYARAIATKPHYADAHNNLGTVYHDQQQWESAIDCYRRAAAAEPGYAKAHYNIGIALQAQGKLAEAAAAFRKAVDVKCDYAEAHYSLALILQKQGRWPEAEAAFQQALRLRPAFAEAHSSLGAVYQAQGRLADALGCYRQSLRIQPDYPEAHYNWGTLLKDQKQFDEALAKYRRAIELKPGFAEAHHSLGAALQQLGRLDEAIAAYQGALRLRPDFALAHNNLGNVYQAQGESDLALACYEQALRIDPRQDEACLQPGLSLPGGADRAETCNNVGSALDRQDKPIKTLACFEIPLLLESIAPEAHYNRALVYLSQGRFLEGWGEFEWRLKCKTYPIRTFSQPLWDGSSFAGRTLLVHAEQGLGDTLHFVRYLPLAKQRGGTLLFAVQPSLLPLLRGSGFDGLLAWGDDLGEFDLQVPLLHLPGIFRTTLQNIPADVPYLAADPRLVDLWRERLASFDGFKVGIHWQGNRDYVQDRYRSIALEEFAPLAGVPGVQLFSLQKYDGVDQLAEVAGQFAIHDFGPQLDEQCGAFMDTAAVMKNLDLVITSDTATPHLAGALGVPVWLALNKVPEWRWLLDGQNSPWYPTMRLFRQSRFDQWPDVFRRMAEELRKIASRSPAG